MAQKTNNLKKIYNIHDKFDTDFCPIRINNSIETYWQNIDENSHDDYESIYNLFSGIDNDKNNNSRNSKKKYFANHFPELNLQIDKLLLCHPIEELEKLVKVNKKIFGIKKEIKKKQKIIGIKKQRYFSFKKNKNNNFCKKIRVEGNLFPFDDPKGSISYNDLKFRTKIYIVKKNGKKKEIPKKRKFKSDDIHKKIKSRFHKKLKNIINKYLKTSKSKKFFSFIPQCFISNISKPLNSKYFNSTYKELLSTDFASIMNKEDMKTSEICQKNYQKNIEVLNYLEQNPDIEKSSGFSIIKNMKYKDLLNKYFKSAQFENSILKLKEEEESPEYINKYIIKANNYINYFNKVNDSKFFQNDERKFDDYKNLNNEKKNYI